IAPPPDASIYASRNTSRCPPQDSRSGWIRYFLSCRALASPTTCRFIPALSELRRIFVGGGATFLRVESTLLIAALWTIPAGVMIGLNSKLAAIIPPIVQVVASVPATALFPIIVLLLARVGGGLAIGSIILILLGTQWYILFNVIAGAIALPTDLKEVCGAFQFGSWERWRKLILPG